MLATERKIAQQEEQIKNLKAIVEGANATITERVEKHESKIIEVDGRVNDIETQVPERLFKTEERQDLYVRMLNELTSNIRVNFDQLTQRLQQFETRYNQSPNFGGPTAAQQTAPNFGMSQPTTTGDRLQFGSAPIPQQTAAGGRAQNFDIGSPLGPNAQTSTLPNSWARYEAHSPAPQPAHDPWASSQRGGAASQPAQPKPFAERDLSVTDLKPPKELVN